jgi:decaprenylphospho-beta-D-erythro-pentofuranosid-2-ulose 2-reductase
MTRGLEAPPLATTPPAVARVVADALDHGAPTVWAPRALRWMMVVLRLLPRAIFRRLRQ